jgi:hypothetical protein
MAMRCEDQPAKKPQTLLNLLLILANVIKDLEFGSVEYGRAQQGSE